MANNRPDVILDTHILFSTPRDLVNGTGGDREVSLCVLYIIIQIKTSFFLLWQSLSSCPIKHFKESLYGWVSQWWEDAEHHEDHTINVTQMSVVNTRAVKITLINNTAMRSHRGTPARHFISTNIKYSSSPSHHTINLIGHPLWWSLFVSQFYRLKSFSFITLYSDCNLLWKDTDQIIFLAQISACALNIK